MIDLQGVINPDKLAEQVAERVVERLNPSPFITAAEAARILHIKHPRNLPPLRKYYRNGKEGRPLYRREEVISIMRERRSNPRIKTKE